MKKEDLADLLRQEILTLVRPPSSSVEEAQLCALSGLSRTPVREILRDLEGQGFLELRVQHSPMVAVLDHSTVRDFFRVAPMVYGAVSELAAENATEGQVDALAEALELFAAALEEGNATARTLANYRFHEILGEMAASPYLLPSFRKLLIDHARVGMIYYHPSSGDGTIDVVLAVERHQAMYQAVAARDAAEAGKLSGENWVFSLDRMRKFLTPEGLHQSLGKDPRL